MTGRKMILPASGAVVVIAFGAVGAADYYYKSSQGAGCAKCHEIAENYNSWRHSSHRSITCTECHASSLQTNVRRVVAHVRGEVPERVHLRLDDVLAMMKQCRRCHQQEYAQWRSGPHGTTYARIFTDPEHNQKRRLTDDCLRCHGMHFEGSIGDLVQPVNSAGPWKLIRSELVAQPAIPCLSCHSMHREGEPLSATRGREGPKQEIARPSLSLMDQRSRLAISLSVLPIPVVLKNGSPVRISPDRRQALCYQCHAPLASREVRSGDDRTPTGVHEGLSCLACHQKHGMLTRASCADCHPRLSNCGRDVEKMDTTFADPKSKHDVHHVACVDCHMKGVPPKRSQTVAGMR